MTARAAHAPPLRFLGLVLGGWICLRVVVVAPGWWSGTGQPAAAPLATAAAAPFAGIAPLPLLENDRVPHLREHGRSATGTAGPSFYLIRQSPYKVAPSSNRGLGAHGVASSPLAATSLAPVPGPVSVSVPVAAPVPGPVSVSVSVSVPGPMSGPRPRPTPGPRPAPVRFGLVAAPAEPAFAPAAASSPSRAPGRWSGSAWLLARREWGAPALAPGGTLGGSQAGARLLYRVNRDPARPLALAGRLYLPLHRSAGAEAAVGVDWQPAAGLPLHLLAERREALGADGRSAFAVTLYGGVSRALPHGLRADAYGQAGVVGIRSRDLFVDGSVRLAAPAGPVELGAAAWGAAQPGATRLDAGPEVSVRIRAGGAALRLAADWRFRVAGDAAPDSGPALTLAADF